MAWMTHSSPPSTTRTTVSSRRALVSNPRRKRPIGRHVLVERFDPQRHSASWITSFGEMPCLSALGWTFTQRSGPPRPGRGGIRRRRARHDQIRSDPRRPLLDLLLASPEVTVSSSRWSGRSNPGWMPLSGRWLLSGRTLGRVFLLQSSRGPQVASLPPGIQTTISPRGPLSDHAS